MSEKPEKPAFDKKKWRTQKYSKKVKGVGNFSCFSSCAVT